MTGGEALVATLVSHGVTQGFCVPGESYLAVLDALRREQRRIRLVTNRHESGATFAAEAYGKLAHRPAVALVTRGPGASNAAIGVHTAAQDSTPLLLCIGHVPTRVKGREAFQEINYHLMYAPIAKAVLEPASSADVAEFTARALRLAVSGRPGPVVLVLPEDITEGEAGDVAIPESAHRVKVAPLPDAVAQAAALIHAATRPIVIAGEMVAFDDATDQLVRFVEASGACVASAWRRQDTFSNNHEAYIGQLGLGRAHFHREAWEECDLVIAAGSRLDDVTTQGFTLLRNHHRLIHIHPDASILARWRADVAILADPGIALAALAEALRPPPPAELLAWRKKVHAAYEAYSTPGSVTARGAVDLARVVETVTATLPPEGIVTNDAGNFATWVHRYYRFTRPTTQAAPGSGAMGYAVPAAIGAKLAKPDRPVVAFVGDGGFLMTGQELTTAVQEGLAIKVIVCDNSAHGTILMHQHKRIGPDAIYGVRIQSPDFAAIGRAYGAAAFTVEKTSQFAEAWTAALKHDGPALVHVLIDIQDISAAGPLNP